MTYLETAKAHIERIDGEHTAEFIRTMSLASIANSIIDIAENVRAERTCHNASYRLDESRFQCSECEYGCWVKDVSDGHDKLPSYCPNCGAKVVDE